MPLADGGILVDPADPAWVPVSLSAMIHKRISVQAWFSSMEIMDLIRPILNALHTRSYG